MLKEGDQIKGDGNLTEGETSEGGMGVEKPDTWWRSVPGLDVLSLGTTDT